MSEPAAIASTADDPFYSEIRPCELCQKPAQRVVGPSVVRKTAPGVELRASVSILSSGGDGFPWRPFVCADCSRDLHASMNPEQGEWTKRDAASLP